MLAGPSACPPESRVGTNDVSVDSGLPGPNRYAMEDVTFFNEPGGMIIVSHDRASGAYVVLHAKVQGGSFDLDQPPLPGTPPDGGATNSERALLFEAVDRGGRSYITTPPTCPASRTWRFTYTYTFRDGRTQTVTSDQRCVRRAGHRLRVRVLGLPRRCTRKAFHARVRVTGGAALRRVDVRLDGRRIATRKRRRFTVPIDAARLHRGRHRLRAVARDRTGEVAVRASSFRRC